MSRPAPGAADPLAAIGAINSLATSDGTAILVLVNFHRFMQSPEVIQAMARQIVAGKQNRTFVIVLSPVVQVPTELEKQIVVIEHELPGRDQLENLAQSLATEEGELPEGDDLGTVLDAASGLTRYEAEAAFSLSLVREGAIRPQSVWELKSQMLKKSGLVTLHRGSESFADLGGLDALKSFCTRAMGAAGRSQSTEATPRRLAVRRTRHGEVAVLQGTRERNGPSHADTGHRFVDGVAGRPDRGQHSPGAKNRRCHVALCVDDRRDRKSPQWCGQFRGDRQRRLSPPLRHVLDVACGSSLGRVL